MCFCGAAFAIMTFNNDASVSDVFQELYRLIRDLNREDHITIVMVSHDIRSILSQANKILHIQQRMLFFGAAADYEKSAAGKAFLGE